MEHLRFLSHAAGLFGLACGFLLVGHRLRVPPVVAMLAAGMLAGPHGLGWIADTHEVELFAELGIILLLFVIGLELSLDEVRRFARLIFVGGTVYVLLCVLGVFTPLWGASVPWNTALLAGFLVALSSTAIVLKGLGDCAQMSAPHGRIVVGILLFQDIAVAPMMLAIPILAGIVGDPGQALLGVGVKTLAVGGLVLVGGRFVVRWLLVRVAAARSRELLLLSVLALCLGIAWATGYLGLSLSLGAFLAGLVVSDSEVSHSVVDAIVPFRDVFTSVFFMSVGMLFDTRVFVSSWALILGLLGALLVLKVAAGCVAGLCLRYPLRTALLAGLALFQIGEFSFVLAGVGMQHGLLGVTEFQIFLSVAILSMAITPTLIAWLPRLGARLTDSSGAASSSSGPKSKLRDHLVIAGYGIGGRYVAQVAQESGIPYVVLEMNPETVRRERAKGVPIAFGDITQPAVLSHWNIEEARAMAILVSDPAAVQRAVMVARQLHPGIHLVVRTRYVAEIEPLLAAGAQDVVVEEYESAIEVLVRVLAAYMVPLDDIARLERRFRAQGYADLRAPQRVATSCPAGGACSTLDVTAVRVEPGSFVEGSTLAESALRQRHGVTVAAVRRGQEDILAPGADWRFAVGDVVYLVGSLDAVSEALPLFRSPGGDDASH
ncbi:MAG: sodium/hydrogen exchanger [Desulfomicrobiaceae bacterium]|nr:sodium/hydrogen exchanger [Desulfomicrobiaceae bacterium]